MVTLELTEEELDAVKPALNEYRVKQEREKIKTELTIFFIRVAADFMSRKDGNKTFDEWWKDAGMTMPLSTIYDHMRSAVIEITMRAYAEAVEVINNG